MNALPDAHGIRIKLAEIYAASGQTDAFSALFEDLLLLLDDEELLALLLRLAADVLPEHPAVAAVASAS